MRECHFWKKYVFLETREAFSLILPYKWCLYIILSHSRLAASLICVWFWLIIKSFYLFIFFLFMLQKKIRISTIHKITVYTKWIQFTTKKNILKFIHTYFLYLLVYIIIIYINLNGRLEISQEIMWQFCLLLGRCKTTQDKSRYVVLVFYITVGDLLQYELFYERTSRRRSHQDYKRVLYL